MHIWSLLAEAGRRWPERPALRHDGLRREDAWLDHRTAWQRATAAAQALRRAGVRPGDRVASLMDNGAAAWFAYFAAAGAGAVLVPLNTRLSSGEQRDVLAHAGAALLLHDLAHHQRAVELSIARLSLDDVVDEAAFPDDGVPLPALAAADSPAHLYYTSGTTGRPKGVVLTHRNVVTHALAAVEELALGAGDTWAHIAPMFHLADAWATFAITAVGGRHVFLPRFDASHALDLLVEARVTITNLVPTMLNAMVKHDGAAGRDYALRSMLSGGAAIAPDTVRRILGTFGCDYVQTYGMTETSPYLTLSLLTAELQRLPPDQQLRWKCKTGRPFRGVELRVVDATGAPVARDGVAVGEIRVRGATVTPGYWHDDAATAAAFDEEDFLRTGDLATVDEHGYVDIVDRLKDVIKSGAESVFSIEVENVLYDHPGVLECAVFGVPDPQWGERVTAAVVLRPGHRVHGDELIAFCRDRIAHYKAPKQVLLLDALPRTGSGKIQKRALRDRFAGEPRR